MGYINLVVGVICVCLLFIHNIKLKKVMADQELWLSVLARIDNTTNGIAEDTTRIAEELRLLKEQIKNQGLPADVEASILASLEAKALNLEEKAAALKQVGKDELPEESEPDEPQA